MVWENTVIFSYYVIFILFSILPKKIKDSSIIFFGFLVLGTAILEGIHAMLYPGFYQLSLGLAVEYWIYARGLFAIGSFITVYLLNKKETPWFFKKALYSPLILSILLIILSLYIPDKIFYVEGKTTFLKSFLEILYACILFISSYLSRHVKPLPLGLFFAGLSNLTFTSYGENVFTNQFVVGHAFLVSSAVILVLGAMIEKVFIPFREMENLVCKYGGEIEDLYKKIINNESLFQKINKIQQLLIESNSIDELLKKLREMPKILDLSSQEDFVIFNKNKLIYKTKEELPEDINFYKNWNNIGILDTSIFYNGLEETNIETLRNILFNLKSRLQELILKKELNYSLEKIKQLDEYRVNFMRAISHELKTPLNVIYGNLQLMESGIYGDISHLEKPIEAIKTGVSRSKELIDNLIDLSRVETGRISVKSELIYFENLYQIIDNYRNLAKEKGLEFSFDFIGDSPFSSDYQILITIISNLLSNAVKYTEKGEIKGRLEVIKNKIIIEVKDTGKGIPSENIPRIFEPFFGERTLESSGLGLTIVKKFVELLKGSIHVESEVDKGSIFRVEMPRLIRPTSFEQKEHVQVLIIDQDKETRNLLKKTLKDFSIIEAENGEEGYIKALEHTPDVVITTLGLPDISGEELVKRLKEEPILKNTKFVFYTGARRRDLEEYFIEKGTDIREVVEKIKIIVGNKILLIYSENTKEYISLAERIFGKLNKEYVLREFYNLTINDLSFYDTFLILLTEEEFLSSEIILGNIDKLSGKRNIIFYVIRRNNKL